MKLRALLSIAILCLCAATAAAQAPDTRKPLGYPIGKFLVIEGMALPKKGKGPERILVVAVVNGEKLKKPDMIEIRNIEQLPENTPIILRGYVSGEYVGTPPEVFEKEHRINIAQTSGFWFATYFIVTSIVEPQDLQLFSRPPRKWTRPVLFDPEEHK